MKSNVLLFGNDDEKDHSYYHREGDKLHVTTIEYKDDYPKELTPVVRIPPSYAEESLSRLSTLVTVKTIPECEIFGIKIDEHYQIKTVTVWTVEQHT
jgi:hypothetical protein